MSIRPAKLRVVIDTNQFVSAHISRMSLPAQLLSTWLRGLFTLVTSESLITEVAGALTRPSVRDRYALPQAEIDELMSILRKDMADPLLLESLPLHCRDPKDDQVLAAALGGNADYIVTGDADLLVLDGHPALGALRIVTVRAFLGLLG